LAGNPSNTNRRDFRLVARSIGLGGTTMTEETDKEALKEREKRTPEWMKKWLDEQ